MKEDWTRYSCQLKLPGFTQGSQDRLAKARVLIVGAGGLGCPASLYLAAAGIGTIGIADYDVITDSNLHRQILYGPADTGKKKGVVAVQKLLSQNPSVNAVAHELKITRDNVMGLLEQYDIVVDGSDNFETKYLLNDACVLAGKPLVFGAIYQYEGQVSTFNILSADGTRTPNYRDLFPEIAGGSVPNCSEGGVLPMLAGMVGSIQAAEVFKYFTGNDELLAGKMLLIDALSNKSRIIDTGRVSKVIITELPFAGNANLISAADLARNLKDYTLVDVRTKAEHDEFNLGGFHIPLDSLSKEIISLDISKPIVFYCASGVRSYEAVKKVQHLIDVKAFSLAGGINEWKNTFKDTQTPSAHHLQTPLSSR